MVSSDLVLLCFSFISRIDPLDFPVAVVGPNCLKIKFYVVALQGVKVIYRTRELEEQQAKRSISFSPLMIEIHLLDSKAKVKAWFFSMYLPSILFN